MKIENLTGKQLEQAKDLLRKNNLPTDDIGDNTRLFGTAEDGVLVGVAGLELYGQDALVRSVCVDERFRRQGMAELLTEHLEQFAKRQGVNTLYLLTTTAEYYFKRKGFSKVNRESVPDVIKHTSEFSSVCPTSAAVLQKALL